MENQGVKTMFVYLNGRRASGFPEGTQMPVPDGGGNDSGGGDDKDLSANVVRSFIAEAVQRNLDKIFDGEGNARTVDIKISKDHVGHHFSVSLGGYIHLHKKDTPDPFCSGYAESRISLDDALANAMKKAGL